MTKQPCLGRRSQPLLLLVQMRERARRDAVTNAAIDAIDVARPLTDGFGRPSIFLINLPVGVVALAFAARFLPADPVGSGPARRRLDIPGALTGTIGLLVVGYAIGALAEPDTRTRAWLLLAAGLAVLAAFVAVERRSPYPLVPPRLFRIREVTGSAGINALVGAAHVPVFALVELYLQNVRDYSPTRSGLAVLPVAVVNIAISRTSSRTRSSASVPAASSPCSPWPARSPRPRPDPPLRPTPRACAQASAPPQPSPPSAAS
ncbi:hypothetical protein [Streptomyces sp. SID3343]|uniref:hypothetical protein n=1 Tax=Streptomyces sp. SID3343 TaxID=2690260 RepID=UPI0013682B4F|nr:hypothetical protein [Streptomyces sp. SID3343]MYW04294.1 hypothetical protein [Streptomyces sp. SID3343]